MFTMENTEGFKQSDLNLMNAAVAKLVKAGVHESNACDIVNNNWQPDGNTVASLIRRNHPNRKPMRDTSIMQGVVEWTIDGTDYRAMDEGASVGIYIKQDGAFVRTATISKPARMTPRAIWNAWKA